MQVIIFSWSDPDLLEKHKLPFKQNEKLDVPNSTLAEGAALNVVKTCFEAGLNVMLYRLPGRDIIWVCVDNKNFQQRQL